MKKIIHISLEYLRYYKRQTAAIFLGIVLAAAMLSGIGGLFESGRQAAVENARLQYGDWHFCIRGDHKISSDNNIKKIGKLEVYSSDGQPAETVLVSADDGYLDIMGLEILSGRYPEKADEIAADEQTLRLISAEAVPGERVFICGEEYTVSGIMTAMPSKFYEDKDNTSQIFVAEEYSSKSETLEYIRFDEKHKLIKQLKSFCKNSEVQYSDIKRNNGLLTYIDGNSPMQMLQVIISGVSDKNYGLPYIWGGLNESGKFSETVILLGIGLFGVFIIYSLFQVSVNKRMAQYSIIEVLGITDANRMFILLAELIISGTAGYPIGCLIGNLSAWIVCGKAGKIFVPHEQRHHTGLHDAASRYSVSKLPDVGRYFPNYRIMIIGAIGLSIAFFVISYSIVRHMKKHTLKQIMSENAAGRRDRKIHSLKRKDLSDIITRRTMFPVKRKALGMMLSLSVGSILFLGAFYVTEATKRNNELTFKADDGLGSDIQVVFCSDNLSDNIPQKSVDNMNELIKGRIHPVRYMLGEIEFRDGIFKWPVFYPETANEEGFEPSPEIIEKYNGRAVQTGDDEFRLKVNIYGYDDEMLKELNEYLLSGNIDPNMMRSENTVILKTLMDGQGNYDGIAISEGDKISVKAPESIDVPKEVLRFIEDDKWYQTQNFRITALVARPLAKVDDFIGDSGSDVVDIIMTNEQMEQYFGVSGYRTVNISLSENDDKEIVSEGIENIAAGIDNCMFKDFTQQIKQQNEYLYSKMFFFYGISAVLFGISLIHLINSMQYMITAKKREFGIMRAMGMTDRSFVFLTAKQGARCGICTAVLIMLIYPIIQKILYYFMSKVYLYIHPLGSLKFTVIAAAALINIFVCIAAALISSKAILKDSIIEEIKA